MANEESGRSLGFQRSLVEHDDVIYDLDKVEKCFALDAQTDMQSRSSLVRAVFVVGGRFALSYSIPSP